MEREKDTGLRWILPNAHLQLPPSLGGFHQLPLEQYFGQSRWEMQGAPRNGAGQCSQSQAAAAEIQTELVPTPGFQSHEENRKRRLEKMYVQKAPLAQLHSLCVK